MLKSVQVKQHKWAIGSSTAPTDYSPLPRGVSHCHQHSLRGAPSHLLLDVCRLEVFRMKVVCIIVLSTILFICMRGDRDVGKYQVKRNDHIITGCGEVGVVAVVDGRSV